MAQQQLSDKALAKLTETLHESISMDIYAQSVKALYGIAVAPTSGGRVAAQVLLSAYNGDNWQLNVADLVNMDRTNLHHALTVMEGRATLFVEPHDFIENGSYKFEKLQEYWKRLHIHNRWKKQCDECHGSGEIYANMDDENDYATEKCPACKGKGLLPEIREFF